MEDGQYIKLLKFYLNQLNEEKFDYEIIDVKLKDD